MRGLYYIYTDPLTSVTLTLTASQQMMLQASIIVLLIEKKEIDEVVVTALTR